MKKNLLKSMLVAVMTVMASSTWAAGYTRTLTNELAVEGYEVKAFYDFQNNSPEVLPTSGDLRYRDGGIWGLHNFGSGTRSATVSIPVVETDILVLQHYSSDVVATINCGTLNEVLTASTGYQVYDITNNQGNITFTIARYGGIVAALVMKNSAVAETAVPPTIAVTGVNGIERTVTITPNVGTEGTAQTAYYTLDGSEPTNASTEYTAPFTVSENTTVKAIAYCEEAVSNVVTLEVEAGFAIKLNDAILKINAMQAKGSQFAPVYGVSVNNSQLIGAPTAMLSATFLGEDVTADLVAGSFVPTANADLVITSSAEGYESNTVTAFVFGTYNQTYASADYSTLTDEASVQSVLGDDWTRGAEPTRWANWNKFNATYGEQYYVYYNTSEAEGNIYLDKDNMLRGPKAIQFMESFGFGRGVSGATKVFIPNTGTPQDITLYRVINSKGANENTFTETFVKSVYNEGKSYSEFDIPGCETLCQAIIYSPVHTYGIVGDLTGGWNVDAEMTETSANVYTLTISGFKVDEPGTYAYKLRADKTWGIYELPSSENFNQEFAEAGTYDLTFTANIAENLLTLTVKDVSPYTLVGAFETGGAETAAFFGETWAPEYAANDMTLQEDGTYTIEFTNVALEAGTIWYKVVKNHNWTINYGMADKKDGNAEYVVNEACIVNKITFTFNPAAEGYKVSCDFADITTGISTVATTAAEQAEVYNMAGQRVMNAQKGLYIVNGKKVVKK